MTAPTKPFNINTEFTALLDQFSSKDLMIAGGKGANLGELRRAGFHVPAGFVITTLAYDRFVQENSLDEIITHSMAEPEPLGVKIVDAFNRAQIPADLEQAIIKAYHRLGEGPVAVRSSATAEDLPEAAFAGQQETYLNVIGRESLLEAVRGCWASLWSDRAIIYRERQTVDQSSVKLAVVIQHMVTPDFAGVLFTANPITGERDEMVIDANTGLGEAVVSGQATPDHYILNKAPRGWFISSRKLGKHELIIRARPEGGTEHFSSDEVAKAAEIPDRALIQLAQTGEEIQRHFERPQDIEWAWVGEELYILQARPMTALPEPPPNPSRLVRMLSALFAEMFPIRPYPLDISTWVPAISEAAVVPIFSIIGIVAPPLESLFTQDDGVIIQFSGKIPVRPTGNVLLAPFRLIQLALKYDSTQWRSDPHLMEGRALARELEAQDLRELSWEGVTGNIDQALMLPFPLAGEVRRHYYPRAIISMGLLRILLGLFGRGDQFGVLTSGYNTRTMASNEALEVLAEKIRSDPALAGIFESHAAGEVLPALEASATGKSFLSDFKKFLQEFGHREVVLSTVLQPTWKDAPELVLGILKGFASTQTGSESEHTQKEAAPWIAARDEVLAHPLMKLPLLKRVFLGLLGPARCFWQIREDSHYDATLILPILRRAFLELGRRIKLAEALDQDEDVFHLRYSELKQIDGIWPPSSDLVSELRKVMMKRKARRASLESLPVVDPRLYSASQAKREDARLYGTPGSPGVAEGTVCVVHDASEFNKLRSGDVLVAPYTNPAWTPLFQRAAAVIVDAGGAGSHAAIVAREYGIPAVMGTAHATSQLRDGERVRVDGNQGLVFDLIGKETGQDG